MFQPLQTKFVEPPGHWQSPCFLSDMHTFCWALFCCDNEIYISSFIQFIYTYYAGLLQWHWINFIIYLAEDMLITPLGYLLIWSVGEACAVRWLNHTCAIRIWYSWEISMSQPALFSMHDITMLQQYHMGKNLHLPYVQSFIVKGSVLLKSSIWHFHQIW